MRFTLPGGQVTISAYPAGDVVDISVTDTGVGIAAPKLSDLFKPDRRSTTIGTAGERGSGLGLILCRELVERQGSVLRVSSTAGVGTAFCFTLSRPNAAAVAGILAKLASSVTPSR